MMTQYFAKRPNLSEEVELLNIGKPLDIIVVCNYYDADGTLYSGESIKSLLDPMFTKEEYKEGLRMMNLPQEDFDKEIDLKMQIKRINDLNGKYNLK